MINIQNWWKRNTPVRFSMLRKSKAERKNTPKWYKDHISATNIFPHKSNAFCFLGHCYNLTMPLKICKCNTVTLISSESYRDLTQLSTVTMILTICAIYNNMTDAKIIMPFHLCVV